jgi:hypothetical protein
MKRTIAAIILSIVSASSMAAIMKKPTDESCKAYMLWKEARNQPIEAQRAVLDVLHHRLLKSRLTACKELMKPSQYPYMRHGVKKVSKEWLTHYRTVRRMPKVLQSEQYLYFNHFRSKHKWATKHKRIGDLVFSREKEKK